MLDSKTLKSLKCKINIKFFGLFFHDQLGDAREQNAILNLVDPELQKDLLVYMHRGHYAVHDTLCTADVLTKSVEVSMAFLIRVMRIS